MYPDNEMKLLNMYPVELPDNKANSNSINIAILTYGHTYPTSIFDVDIGSFVKKAFQNF